MRYTILGTTQALRDDGTPATLAGGRLRALLTALALRPGRVLTADALIDDVWDGDPPAGATGALQALVGRLRRAIGHDAVDSVEGGYRLAAGQDDVDLYRFERLADEGSRALADGDPVKAVGLLGDALALWRGPALADLPDRGTAALRSEALRLDVRRMRLTAELDLGRAAHILPELAELAAAHPLDEPLHALHIRALRAAGRTADALTAYDAVRRALADGLGADPSPELQSLYAELLNPGPLPSAPRQNGGDHRDRAAERAGRPERPAGNARARLTSFVGREVELNAVQADLARARLVTITGPGGTGKTRLSQETGDRVSARWPDGVWYVELAPVSDPRTLPEAVISSLGLRETLLHGGSAAEAALSAEKQQRDPARQLADYCANRRLLLVFDNCEHVIAAAATLAEQLLADCPDLSILATSREPLGVPGELVRPLDPLPDPTAMRLLADRGASARPGFSTEEDPVACAELCRRLDGLPLAIELAAARLRSLSPRQLADRLDDRFRLLTGGARTLLPRQQTLRAVVDWSWDLLEPAERVLLRRLAVFRGGWTLEAVEAICADLEASDPEAPDREAPDPGAQNPGTSTGTGTGADRIAAPDVAALLASLVDKSLVLAEQTTDGTRCRMLETISEYAAGRLDESGERPAVERRHMRYFREFARLADSRLRGAGQLLWFERLESEHENLRAAMRRAVAAGDEQEALVLVLGCAWFWEVRNYSSERRYWPAAVAAMGLDPFQQPPALVPVERGPLEDPPPLDGERLAEARRWARVVSLTAAEGEHEWWTDPEAINVGKAMIASYPPHLPQSARFPGLLRAFGAFFSGDFIELRRLIDETVEACRTHNRVWELAYALQLRAKVNNDISEEMANSLRDIAESRSLFERLGDEWGMAETLSGEAEAAGNGGDWARAIVCCREGIALARKLGSHQHVPVLTVRLGDALVSAGEVEEGERMLREGIKDSERFGSAAEGAGFFGRMLLVAVLSRRDLDAAMALIDETILIGTPGDGTVPDFVAGMMRGVKGFLVGKAGDPETGLRMIVDGVGVLSGHPLASVITPRLALLLSPGAVELLTALAADAPPGDPRAARRAHRAAALVAAHDRLRPNVMPPVVREDLDACVATLRSRFGDQAYETGYAEGDGLSLEEAVALMRDVD
ncbi:AfsR/SARP family transcriptional regulator [Streptomyces sp. CA-111067]|uniref:AfsR/SARP family transcriptional regulator n=1 Tax=Streptomyces sp. CA-111067 TaxID=3240046 RepID=UPI003D969ACB